MDESRQRRLETAHRKSGALLLLQRGCFPSKQKQRFATRYGTIRHETNLEHVGRLRVERADGRVQSAAVRGAHGWLVQRAPERVEGDVDRTAVRACLLHFVAKKNIKKRRLFSVPSLVALSVYCSTPQKGACRRRLHSAIESSTEFIRRVSW